MAKMWLQDRWDMLLPLLQELTREQEAEIALICTQEIEAWKARPTMKSLSSLKEPMTDTRNKIRELALTDQNSYLNLQSGKREHIALKYLNYSEAEWAQMNARSQEKFQQRLEDRKLLDHPDAIVALAKILLQSKHWDEIAVGLTVATGRRLSEVLKVGVFAPKTNYTITFSGQLKRQDKILDPYEIPTLVEAHLVISAWQRLRAMLDTTTTDTEQISIKYGPSVVAVAQQELADLVPPREGADLYTHLFRAVYGRIATFYYALPRISDLKYMATIYGHYWVLDATGEQQQNYASTMHYSDYLIGDGHGNIDGRQGIRLGEPGVTVLEKFQEKPVIAAKVSKKKKQEEPMSLLPTTTKKDHSLARVGQATKSRLLQVQKDLGSRTEDDALATLIDEHYVLQQIIAALTPQYEQLGTDNPISAVQALLSDGGTLQIDQKLSEHYKTSLMEVIGLLDEAATLSEEHRKQQAHHEAKKHEDKKAEPPVAYLRGLLSAKQSFKKSYEKRHVGKDYTKLPTSILRRTKTTEAAQERFRRAVDTIMTHNDTVTIPEFRRFISPAFVVDLVGGRPPDARDYIASRKEEIEAHHTKYGLTLGVNRIVLQSVKVEVPEWPQGVSPTSQAATTEDDEATREGEEEEAEEQETGTEDETEGKA